MLFVKFVEGLDVFVELLLGFLDIICGSVDFLFGLGFLVCEILISFLKILDVSCEFGFLWFIGFNVLHCDFLLGFEDVDFVFEPLAFLNLLGKIVFLDFDLLLSLLDIKPEVVNVDVAFIDLGLKSGHWCLVASGLGLGLADILLVRVDLAV